MKNLFRVIAALFAGGSLFLLMAFLFGYQPYVVLSGSMEPSVRAGSVIFADTRFREINANDIITFQNGSGTVTHRAVQVNENGAIITKGDANKTEDPVPVSASQVVGIVRFSLPCLGYLVLFVRTPLAYILLVLMILTIYLYHHIYQFQPGRKKGLHNENK